MTILSVDRQASNAEGRHVDNPPDQGKRRWRPSGDLLASLPLVVPMTAGAILSFGGQYEAARPWFDPTALAALVPVAIDGAILTCGVQWIYAARHGRRAHGWRSATHFFVGLTIWLNYLATPRVPFLRVPAGDYRALAICLHIGGAVVWAVLAELLARAMTQKHVEEEGEVDRIPLGMWATRFRESWRTKVRMWRTGERNADVARIDAYLIRGAGRRVSRLLGEEHQAELGELLDDLAAGSILPEDVLAAVRSHDASGDAGALVDELLDRALAASVERRSLARSGDSLARSPGRAGRRASERVGERMGERADQASEWASESPTGERANGRASESPDVEVVADQAGEQASESAAAAASGVGGSPGREDDVRRLIEAYDRGALPTKPNGEVAEMPVRELLGVEPGKSAGPSRARPAQKALNEHIRRTRSNGHAQEHQTA